MISGQVFDYISRIKKELEDLGVEYNQVPSTSPCAEPGDIIIKIGDSDAFSTSFFPPATDGTISGYIYAADDDDAPDQLRCVSTGSLRDIPAFVREVLSNVLPGEKFKAIYDAADAVEIMEGKSSLHEKLSENIIDQFVDKFGDDCDFNDDGVITSVASPAREQITQFFVSHDPELTADDIYSLAALFTPELFEDLFMRALFVTSKKDPTKLLHLCDSVDWANMPTVKVPPFIKIIGKEAFEGMLRISNSRIEELIIPEGVTTVEESAFICMGNINHIQLPDSLTHIGPSAFAQSTIDEIKIPPHIQIIPDHAFYCCDFLQEVDLSGAHELKSIESAAFNECTALTHITIPKSVTSIAGDAFVNCSSLSFIQLCGAVKDAEQLCFTGCTPHLRVVCDDKETYEKIKRGGNAQSPRITVEWSGGAGAPLTEDADLHQNEAEQRKSEEINDFIEDLYDLRKSSIEKDGEYGMGNLIFKEFRNLGYLDNLRNLKNEYKSKELSLEQLNK